MYNIKAMIENPHKVNRRYAAYWDFLIQSYEGGIDYSNSRVLNSNQQGQSGLFDSLFRIFINGQQQNTQMIYGNLFMHPKERVEDYNRRVNMSYYYNFCYPIIDIYSDHLFKQAVVEDWGSIEETIKQVTNNIDRMGTSIQDFRRNVADMAQVYGHCFVVVDSPQNSKTKPVLTRADQIEERAFPYLTLYAPQRIKNWALDEFGFPYWVIVEETFDANRDPADFKNSDENIECQYRLWTRDAWFLYDDNYELIDEGTHDLGEVPIVCIFDKKSKKQRNFLGISQIADISFIARDIYNASSELRQILRDQTFSFLALQGSSDEYGGIDLGTGKGLLYPEGRNAPQYISPPADNATIYFDHIDRQIIKIFQLARIEAGASISGSAKSLPAGGATVDSQSGVSKAWSFNQTNSSLSTKSSNLEEGEIRWWRLFAKWEEKDFDGSIQYPNEFSITNIMDDINEAESEANLALGKSFNIAVKSAIVKKKFPRATDQEIETMISEIENLEGIAEKNSQQTASSNNFAQRMRDFAAGKSASATGAGANNNGNRPA